MPLAESQQLPQKPDSVSRGLLLRPLPLLFWLFLLLLLLLLRMPAAVAAGLWAPRLYEVSQLPKSRSWCSR